MHLESSFTSWFENQEIDHYEFGIAITYVGRFEDWEGNSLFTIEHIKATLEWYYDAQRKGFAELHDTEPLEDLVYEHAHNLREEKIRKGEWVAN
jgi:hypothetical protein